MRNLICYLTLAANLIAANSAWLDRVDPLLSSAEKKTYFSLKPDARREFEENFFTGKAIAAADYFERVSHIDSAFGSGKPGSGANTDQGRVYLALGPPVKIARFASSRLFVPVEIWYYDVVPGLLNTELRLMFFQKNLSGYPKLYSPQVDTIRALLQPQASTIHMLGPNDSTSESDLRGVLQVRPAEDEILTASLNVATGIKYSGNEEILGKVSSPAAMLNKPPRTEITSRLITYRPTVDVVQSISPYGAVQVDLRLETAAQREIDLEVIANNQTVYQNRLHLKFPGSEPVLYTHRLDLLPGSYRALFTVDGKAYPYALDVVPGTLEIHRADVGSDVVGRETPFEFEGRRLELNPDGRFAFVALERPGKVTWMLHRGAETVWKASSDGQQIASIQLPTAGIQPGTYKLEAATADTSASADFIVGRESATASKGALVSFNANLAPARRLAFIGHQWLLRGKLREARGSLDASLALGLTDEAKIELARIDALEGNLDAAREKVAGVLAAKPDDFEALSVFAYIETRLQDYTVAAQLYRRALAVQDSPAIRAALAKLPAE